MLVVPRLAQAVQGRGRQPEPEVWLGLGRQRRLTAGLRIVHEALFEYFRTKTTATLIRTIQRNNSSMEEHNNRVFDTGKSTILFTGYN